MSTTITTNGQAKQALADTQAQASQHAPAMTFGGRQITAEQLNALMQRLDASTGKPLLAWDADGNLVALVALKVLPAALAQQGRNGPPTGYLTLASLARKDASARVSLPADERWPEVPFLEVTASIRAFDQSPEGKRARTNTEANAAIARAEAEIERTHALAIKRLPLSMQATASAKAEGEVAYQRALAANRVAGEYGLPARYTDAQLEALNPHREFKPTPAHPNPSPDVDPAFVQVDPVFRAKTREEVVADLRSLLDAGKIDGVEATRRLHAWERAAGIPTIGQ